MNPARQLAFQADLKKKVSFTQISWHAGMRALDEATQYADPCVWTAQRDIDMWQAPEG